MTSNQQIIEQGFTRVERDDRLLDILPKETREFGIELWERWNRDMVELVRIHFQTKQQPQHFVILREKLTYALLKNQHLKLR